MRHLGILITFLLLCTNSFSLSTIGFKDKVSKSTMIATGKVLNKAEFSFLNQNNAKGIKLQSSHIEKHAKQVVSALRDTAFRPSIFSYAGRSSKYTQDSFSTSTTINIDLSSLGATQELTLIDEKYIPKIDFLAFVYLYVSLIGFYIAAIIHFNKKIDTAAKILISCFIFIHSIFILHIGLNMTNYQYQFPHSFRMSTLFSFLYGPLLYFYFKRISQQYKFKKIDALHLMPTLILFLILFPTYALSGEEKLSLMIERVTIGRSITDLLIIIFKLASLLIYGYFIRKVYLNSKKSKGLDKQNRLWQRNIYVMHFAYICCYAAYGLLLGNGMTFGWLYHTQVVLMASMVMYIGYSANVQPNVFGGSSFFDNPLFLKYEKSGLTDSLSQELKNNLLVLLDHKKIYKENDISLEILARQLNTTRHNASQVINEHFNMNFHELINKYRINEAKHIFDIDSQKNLNIIDVAYEVGYNNKVTFNKAFKKDTNLTPSEYQRLMLKNPPMVKSQ